MQIFQAQVTFEKEVKISDIGLHFDGSKVAASASNTGENSPYDYYFGDKISAHGDCITSYGDYVFVTWYKGGKAERNVILTRFNTKTNTTVTIEFPHRHTGYLNQWWIGESHNTIAVGVSPLDGTIHLLYDMHSYSNSRPTDGAFSNDYFRYSYSVKNAASLSDEEFTLDKFVKNSNDGYKHLSLNGGVDYSNFSALTYPKFFLNDSGDLFMYMREGGNNNGAYKFSKYNASTSTWSGFTHFNVLNAKNQSGITYNWGLYGDIKYVNGKMRIGFQRRSQNNNDKYLYQNGVYYAYSDDQDGFTQWKNYKGEDFSLPLYDADFIKVMEPGDYVETTQANQVYIVSDFDWTVTENEDVHIISKVKDNENNVTKSLHTYKPAGATDFITSEDFAGAETIYTSGTDIFIIGLTGGRVYVEKAEGGTNDFTRVYQQTSGKIFNHGQVYIKDGKLYYYLMERTSRSAQPLYLQIIDLGIIQDPFRVSITSPSNDQNINVGETLQINADAVNETGSISKVAFKIDDTVFDTSTTAPYNISWTPSTKGVYTLQVVAYNENDETVISVEITVNVRIDDPSDLSGDVYRIKNVATGRYLDSEGTFVLASESGEGEDKEWEFVKSGDANYYNIDSRVRGILRFAGGSAGTIINTGFEPPKTDVDKIWTVISEGNGVFSFEAKNSGRYLYNEVDNTISHSTNTDDRSKWVVELASTPLSVEQEELFLQSIKVYPNPVTDKFTIAFKSFTKADIIISNMLGKVVYKKITTQNNVTISKKLNSGIYLLRVIGDNRKVYNYKIIVK